MRYDPKSAHTFAHTIKHGRGGEGAHVVRRHSAGFANGTVRGITSYARNSNFEKARSVNF